jgi:plasmid stabilization system protein ParE
MEIRWSAEAVEDLEQIVEYIERDKPSAAQKIAEAIYNRIEALLNAP